MPENGPPRSRRYGLDCSGVCSCAQRIGGCWCEDGVLGGGDCVCWEDEWSRWAQAGVYVWHPSIPLRVSFVLRNHRAFAPMLVLSGGDCVCWEN